jgi:hypothetical protein
MSAGLLNVGPARRAQAPLLDSVTLVAITSVALPATVRALVKSMEQARFGHVVLLSDYRPSDLPDRTEQPAIEWRRIAPIRSRDAYSRFILDHLSSHVETPFALVVQWDGYVLDGSAWQGAFLDYDYIGAPWPQFDDGRTVGNGGFSLRSKRLLEACRGLPLGDNEPEDVLICRTARPELESKYGLRFAPESLARRFGYERTPSQGNEFGFHGVFNMIRDMPPPEFATLLSTLEAGLLGKRESGEILRTALRNAHLPTIAQALRQKFALRRASMPSGTI